MTKKILNKDPMKFLSTLLMFLSIALNPLFSQIYNPVKWTMDYNQVNETEFDLIYTAKIQDGWTIYSQYLESDDGPVATSFEYDDAGKHFSIVGKNKESDKNRQEAFDKLFDMNVIKFKKKATFTQRVKVTDISKPVTGYLTFMTCDDTKCLPPTDVDFEFKLAAKADTGANTTPAPTKKIETTPTPPKPEPKVVTTPPTTKTNTTTNNKVVQQTTPSPKKEITKTVAPASKKVTAPIAKAETKTAAKKEEPSAAIKDDGILNPVKWNVEIKKAGDKLYDLVFTANMDKGWSIYSQHTDDNGPVPTSFDFDPSDHFALQGEAIEKGKKKEGPDPLFDNAHVIKYVKGPVTFTQKVMAKDINKSITGYLTYMTCDNARCLPPTEVDFVVNPANLTAIYGDDATAALAAMTGDNGANAPTPVINNTANSNTAPFPMEVANVDVKNPVKECGNTERIEESSSFWRIFVLGFFGGLLALLTPCVFPMIPLTVSFFTKGSEDKAKGVRNALLYGFFILMVYLLLSVPFHLMDSINPDILNDISTNVYLNVAFFLIFLFFAFSFFGYYELTLPQSWTNKSSSAEGAGGILGIFFMALTLALVSFSCTGPILGSLLAGAMTSDGGAFQLTAGMGGFGLALALPFALFAAFPGWLNTLPKSGGWLTTVKVVLGFLELALALKFLSNADLVKHWGLLKIEPFLILWIIIFIGLGLYLFGKIKFPHDSPIAKLSLVRKALGAASIGFALYLATGFMYNDKTESFTPLTLLSGLAPPVGYSWIYPKECPNNLNCFKDFDKGLAYAQKVNKPILVDFTGHACVNCRKMEEHVWPRKQVSKYLEEDYVLISLYVDEKLELPKEEQVTVNQKQGGTRKLRTTGNKWSYFQTEYFDNNSQPYYILMTPEGKMLNTPTAYTPDVDEYAAFLQCGLDAYNGMGKKVLGER